MLCPTCGSENDNDALNCLMCGTALTVPSSPHLPVGAKLSNERYSIGKVLGEGGFGVTYQGADTTMKRLVAIKELFPHGSTRQNSFVVPARALGTQGFAVAKTSFLQEVNTLAQFSHEGIVRVYDTFEDNGTAYLVMEFLQGETLAQRLDRLGAIGGSDVLEIAHKLASALKIVHEAGLLHRDIKPDNIFFNQDNRVVLIDFGSARQFASEKTSKHTQFITPGYAPLEQYASEAKFGPYTDIYALGATLHHAATGNIPPSANDRIMGIELTSLPQDTPAQLHSAIQQALSMKVDDRPQNIEEFVALLDQEVSELPDKKEKPTGILSSLELVPKEERTLRGHRSYVSTVTFNPDGTLLASGGDDKTVKVWEVASGKLTHTITGYRDVVFDISFYNNENIAVAGGDPDIFLWQVRSGQRLGTMRGHTKGVLALSYNSNKQMLASAGGNKDKFVRLWRLPSKQLVHALEGHNQAVRSLAFSPDGTLLASGSDDFTIKLWETVQGKAKTIMASHHTDSVSALAFHPQGNILASGSEDETIKLWDVRHGECTQTLKGHKHWIRSLVFSPDGKLLASGSADTTIKLWEVATGELLHTLTSHNDWVKSLDFSPDGKLLASASGDATIKLWKMYQ